MDDVRAGRDQGAQPRLQIAGRRREARGEILLLPLRDPNDDREIGAHGGAHGGQNLGGEAAPFGDGRPAKGVVAFIGPLPEELVNQVAVGAVKLHSVEAQALGVGRCGGEGRDGVGHLGVGHGIAEAVTRTGEAGGAVIGAGRLPFGMPGAHGADMPELGGDEAALAVDRLGHLAPGGQFRRAVEPWNVRIIQGSRPGDARPLGDDKTDLGRGAPRVIGRHIRRRDSARRLGARHGRHDHAVGQT